MLSMLNIGGGNGRCHLFVAGRARGLAAQMRERRPAGDAFLQPLAGPPQRRALDRAMDPVAGQADPIVGAPEPGQPGQGRVADRQDPADHGGREQLGADQHRHRQPVVMVMAQQDHQQLFRHDQGRGQQEQRQRAIGRQAGGPGLGARDRRPAGEAAQLLTQSPDQQILDQEDDNREGGQQTQQQIAQSQKKGHGILTGNGAVAASLQQIVPARTRYKGRAQKSKTPRTFRSAALAFSRIAERKELPIRSPYRPCHPCRPCRHHPSGGPSSRACRRSCTRW